MSDAALKVSRKLQAIMGAVDEIVTEIAGEPMAVVILVAPFNVCPAQTNYIANCVRSDAQKLARSFADLDGADVPLHERN